MRTATDGSYTLDGQGAVLVTVGTDAIRHEAIGDAGTKVTQNCCCARPRGHSAFVSALSTELAQVMDGKGATLRLPAASWPRASACPKRPGVGLHQGSGDELAKLKAENASVTALIASASAQAAPADALAALNSSLALNNIQTIVVIYAENRGFDNLYGLFPGANGVPGVNPTSSAAYVPQKDIDGSTLPVLPPTWGGMTAAGQSTVITQAQSANLPNKPFQINDANSPLYLPQSVITRDL